MNVVQKGFILVAIPFVFMGGVLASTLWLADTEAGLLSAESRSKRITTLSSDVAAHVLNCRAAVSLYTLTRDDSYLFPLKTAGADLDAKLDLLERSAADDDVEQRYIAVLRKRAQAILSECRQYVKDLTNGGQQTVVDAFRRHSLTTAIHALNATVDDIRLRELYLTGSRPSELAHFKQKFQVFVIVTSLLGIILTCALSAFFASQISRRLLLLSKNAQRLAEEEPLLEPLSGEDEIARVDKAFHESATALKKLQALRAEFLAIIMHDLRSPLSSILLVLQTLRHGLYGDVSKEAQKALHDAQQSGDRLLRLINSLLTADKVACGALELDKRECNASEILKIALAETDMLALEKSIKICRQIPEHSMIIADRDRLVQVCINLLANAIKFSPPESSISVKCIDSDNDLRIEVSDQGRGVPADQIPYIFDKYKQVTAGDAFKGSGLGLHICKGIVEAHGGTIGVESSNGNGSMFWFSVPKSPRVLVQNSAQ